MPDVFTVFLNEDDDDDLPPKRYKEHPLNFYSSGGGVISRDLVL